MIKLLTVKNIAEMLNSKPSTVYAWAEKGIIPSLKINGSLRFDESEIIQWLRTCKKEPLAGYNAAAGRRPGKEGRI